MTISDTTWDNLDKLGFERERRPDGYLPELPHDVTDLTDANLMRMYSSFVTWSCYAANLLADAESDELAAKQDLAVASAQAQVRAADERTVAGRKAAAQADEVVQQAEDARLRVACLAKALALVNRNAETRAQLLSRELSRRLARNDRENRSAKWGS